MIQLLAGILVGAGLGFALFHAHSQSNEIYLASLALMILLGMLIPLEQLGRRMDELLVTLQGIKTRMDQLEIDAEETRDEEIMEKFPHFAEKEQEHYIPAIQANSEGRTVMAHGRRTVERSVEDLAKKLSSMQRGE
ncbi:MAG: hypothetical protein H7839_09355 [Magnetococcus sp. YQC-5]